MEVNIGERSFSCPGACTLELMDREGRCRCRVQRFRSLPELDQLHSVLVQALVIVTLGLSVHMDRWSNVGFLFLDFAANYDLKAGSTISKCQVTGPDLISFIVRD